MTEEDWEGVVDIIEDLVGRLDEASTELCEKRYFKACIAIHEKIVPELVGLLAEAKARVKVAELAVEGAEEEVEGEEEGEE